MSQSSGFAAIVFCSNIFDVASSLSHRARLSGHAQVRTTLQLVVADESEHRLARNAEHCHAAEHWDTVDYVRLYQGFGLLPANAWSLPELTP
jgi:hypothetical protein